MRSTNLVFFSLFLFHLLCPKLENSNLQHFSAVSVLNMHPVSQILIAICFSFSLLSFRFSVAQLRFACAFLRLLILTVTVVFIHKFMWRRSNSLCHLQCVIVTKDAILYLGLLVLLCSDCYQNFFNNCKFVIDLNLVCFEC